MPEYAWVTLATNDSYSLGALVLAHSLKQVGTIQKLVVLITPGVTKAMREKLATVFNIVQEVNILDSNDETNLKLLKRPELGITFTKLHCWRLTQFDKCVFLDADTLVLQNCDELFDKEEFSAAPDVGWPDCFNSGVFVYRPSNDTYEKLIKFALEKGSFDGGDQGLLNLYFHDWATTDISKHLPFIYNMCSTASYSYLPAFKQFGINAKIIHFIGSTKPWLQYFNTETKKVHPASELKHLDHVLQLWWDIFCRLIHANLTPEMGGLAGAFAQLTLGTARTEEQNALDDHLRRQGWEVGNIDYLGRDSFENIWSKICETLSSAPPPPPTPKPQATPIVELQSPLPPQQLPTTPPIAEPPATTPQSLIISPTSATVEVAANPAVPQPSDSPISAIPTTPAPNSLAAVPESPIPPVTSISPATKEPSQELTSTANLPALEPSTSPALPEQSLASSVSISTPEVAQAPQTPTEVVQSLTCERQPLISPAGTNLPVVQPSFPSGEQAVAAGQKDASATAGEQAESVSVEAEVSLPENPTAEPSVTSPTPPPRKASKGKKAPRK